LRAEVITIPWGVGELFMTDPPPVSDGDREPCLVYVGARWKYKNFGVLVRALETASDLRDLRLVLVGGEPLGDGERAHVVRALGASERLVHVAGAPDDLLRRLYDSAAALVVTSRCEGFGLPLLEAMARGCPVACTAGGASEEVAGGLASTFDPDSPSGCAEAIRAAVSAPSLSRASAQARARGYEWRRAAEAHVAAYLTVERMR
jgi:glycosyltransferase involved in cell wall biosynthesis